MIQKGIAIVIALLCCVNAVEAQSQMDDDWNKTVAAHNAGQATGVGIDSHNHVFIFHRASRAWLEDSYDSTISDATVMMLDGTTGALLASWGANQFVMPHGLSVDADDNVWLTDVMGQTVQKFSHDGEWLMTLGTPGVAGDDAPHFNSPSDVGFGPTGDIYISDGYINTRIVRFSPDGRFKMAWGTPGTSAGEFHLPHGLAVTAEGRVYVADRDNSRLQVFDLDGQFIKVLPRDLVGRPYGVAVAPDGTVYVINGGDQPDETKAELVIVSADDQPIARIETRQATDQEALGHDVDRGPDGAIYIVDAWARRILKLWP